MGFPKLTKKKRSNKSSNSKSNKKKNDLLTAANTSHRMAMTKKSSSNVTDATTTSRSPTASLNSSTASLVVEDDYNDYDDDSNIGGVLESYSVRTTVLLNSKQLEKMKLQDEEHAAAASSVVKSSATTASTVPMTLTSQEREWALAIKALLKTKDPTLASQVTDFEVAHHALIAKSKSNKALKRIQRLHKFRNDHGLLHPYQFVIDNNNTSHSIDTQLQNQVEDAMKSILEFHEKSGGMFLAFGRTYPSGNHDDESSSRAVALLGYNTFLPSRLASKEDWITCFQAYYYLLEAVHPHLAACRNGGDVLFECQNAGYHNFSFTMEKHAASLCLQAYPIRPVVAMVLHAPAIFKVLYKMVQPLLTQKLKQLLQLNGSAAQAHQQYGPELLPTKLGGSQTTDQTMQAFRAALTEKYRNMATFRL